MDDFWFGDELAHPSGPDVSNVGFSEAGAFGALEIAVAFGCAVALDVLRWRRLLRLERRLLASWLLVGQLRLTELLARLRGGGDRDPIMCRS